jgi:hypothetical protein
MVVWWRMRCSTACDRGATNRMRGRIGAMDRSREALKREQYRRYGFFVGDASRASSSLVSTASRRGQTWSAKRWKLSRAGG